MKEKVDINRISEEELDAMMADVLSGNASPEEEETLSAWRAADPSHEEEYKAVAVYWNAELTDRFHIDADKELSRLMKRIDSSAKRRKLFSVRNWWMGAAVAASLVAGVVLGWNFTRHEVVTSQQYSLITGESISTFTLPDGSIVHLNKNSRLDYGGNFGKDVRKVHLKGEGYFDVKRMEDCKFIVDLDGASITVRGTSFNAYNNEASGMKGAALVSGSIEFQSGTQNIQLTPSRQAMYDSVNNELTISVFDPSLVTDWKDRLFRYKSLTIHELVEQIMDVYDVKIVCVDDPGLERFSGALDIGLPASSVMDLFSMQTGLSWEKRNGVYYISKK